jgi:hypothetical protein
LSEHTTWGAINENDVVEGPNGSLWSVRKIAEDGTITCLNTLSGKVASSKPEASKPVVRVVKGTHALSTSRALVAVQLGGEDIGHRNAMGEWLQPVDYTHPGALITHLMLFHGVYGGAVAGQPLPALAALHTHIHEPAEQSGGFKEHVHDPEFERRVAANE